MNPPTTISNAAERVTGMPQPDDAIARRVLVALEDGRIEDAEQNLRKFAAEAPGTRAWEAILRGRVFEARGRLSEAADAYREVGQGEERLSKIQNPIASDKEPLPQGRSSALDDHGSESKNGPHSGPYEDASGRHKSSVSNSGIQDGESAGPRLAALALEYLGRVLRRMDDLDGASEAHRAALEIRERVGSWEECRQSAHELALDAAVARKYDDAIAWHRRALKYAQPLGDLGLPLQAETLMHIARVLRSAGDHSGAAEHARASFELRKRVDPGSFDTLRAALELAECELQGATESAGSASTPRDTARLSETIATLTELRGEFLAWGSGTEDEVARVDEALDFARRLLESSVVK